MVSDATRVRVAWGPVPQASGFRISWSTGSGQCGVCGGTAEGTNEGMGAGGDRQEPCQHFPLTSGPESSQTLPPDSTVTDITGLQPGTTYQVAVSVLRGREEGPAAVIVARTGQGLPPSLDSLPPLLFQTPMPPLADPCYSPELLPPPSDSYSLLPQRLCFPFSFSCLPLSPSHLQIPLLLP